MVTKNSTPGTTSDTTFSHNFGGAGAGWLAIGPMQAPPPTPLPPTPTPGPPPVAPPPGMPTTGTPMGFALPAPLAALASLLCVLLGLAIRRQRARG